MISSQTPKCKSSIIDRIGGETSFGFVVFHMVESVRNDPSLDTFFSPYDQRSLDMFHRSILRTIFFSTNSTKDYDDASRYIFLRFYRLFERGFNEKHFDRLVNHCARSMEDSWVADEVCQDAIQILKSFRNVFVGNKKVPTTLPGKEESYYEPCSTFYSYTTTTTPFEMQSYDDDDDDDQLSTTTEATEAMSEVSVDEEETEISSQHSNDVRVLGRQRGSASREEFRSILGNMLRTRFGR